MVRAYKNDKNKSIESLNLSENFPNCISIFYTPTTKSLQNSSLSDNEKKQALSFKHELLLINSQDDFIEINPIITFPDNKDFLNNKYVQIESIVLDGFGFSAPESIEELLDLLEDFPAGFIKDFEYGLGLQKEYRFIIHAIEEISSINTLKISENDETNISANIYTLSYKDFELIRKGVNRISTSHQNEGRIEKDLFSYNFLLHKLNPSTYEERFKTYKKDVIYKFLSSTEFNDAKLTKTDTTAVINIIDKSKQSIFNNNDKKLLQLKDDIELLNLESLISKMEKLLNSNANEPRWQSLLNDNPFILSLVFGYPVIKVQDQASVGGRKLSGSGDKITDFLFKNNLTWIQLRSAIP